MKTTVAAPIVLVPGFWLGAWAWDEVVELLRADGHDVTAITLPGQNARSEDRSAITFGDHVDAIVNAVKARGRPVVLAVHSASGFSGYAASDRVPELIAAMVYVDTAPGKPPLDPRLEGDKDLDWESVSKEENLEGLTPEHIATLRQRAVPVPGGVVRGTFGFTNERRRDIPSTIVATGYPSAEYQKGVEQGWSFLAGIPELRDLTWIDLPTSHWPMWSRPRDLAQIIGDIAAHRGDSRTRADR